MLLLHCAFYVHICLHSEIFIHTQMWKFRSLALNMNIITKNNITKHEHAWWTDAACMAVLPRAARAVFRHGCGPHIFWRSAGRSV